MSFTTFNDHQLCYILQIFTLKSILLCWLIPVCDYQPHTSIVNLAVVIMVSGLNVIDIFNSKTHGHSKIKLLFQSDLTSLVNEGIHIDKHLLCTCTCNRLSDRNYKYQHNCPNSALSSLITSSVWRENYSA